VTTVSISGVFVLGGVYVGSVVFLMLGTWMVVLLLEINASSDTLPLYCLLALLNFVLSVVPSHLLINSLVLMENNGLTNSLRVWLNMCTGSRK